MPSLFLKSSRTTLVVQLLGSLFILVSGVSNELKLVAFLCLWIVTFWPVRRLEIVLFIFACVFFSVMNILSLRQGIFRFTDPDLQGMPAYEFVMWGFYLLHTRRVLAGQTASHPSSKVWILAILYAISFATISSAQALLLVTALLLVLALMLYHEPLDLAYVGYMVLLGAAVEYLGTGTGQWTYPTGPVGGVPLWFVTLWGGVGFFLRRLAVPILMPTTRARVPIASLPRSR